MSPPTVRVNTFVQENKTPFIDSISKIFIISEIAFGVTRLPLLGNIRLIYVILTFIYSLILQCALVYTCLVSPEFYYMRIVMLLTITHYIFCAVFSFASCKRMERYYRELNKFDIEVGCRPRIIRGSIENIVQTLITTVYIFVLFFLPYFLGLVSSIPKQFIPFHVLQTLEIDYYGHLLNLLTPRLRLINYYIESSLSSAKSEKNPYANDFIYFKNNFPKNGPCRMKKLMEIYNIITEAYNFLIEAIKWQLLLTIITAFITILGLCYIFSLNVIRARKENIIESLISEIGLSVALIIPLFAPCTFSDRVHNEVRRLRELLASRLYDNKLDKSDRSVARALLAFTETRDLSFRLLRMLKIDISLPFKCMGLLVTYLIILLQFEKVINP